MQLSEGSLCVPYGWGSMCVTARNYFNGRGQNAPCPAGITPAAAACNAFCLEKMQKVSPFFVRSLFVNGDNHKMR